MTSKDDCSGDEEKHAAQKSNSKEETAVGLVVFEASSDLELDESSDVINPMRAPPSPIYLPTPAGNVSQKKKKEKDSCPSFCGGEEEGRLHDTECITGFYCAGQPDASVDQECTIPISGKYNGEALSFVKKTTMAVNPVVMRADEFSLKRTAHHELKIGLGHTKGNQNRRRIWVCILVLLLVAGISFLLVRRRSGDESISCAPSPNPTNARTNNPSAHQTPDTQNKEAALIGLIQARMPSTTFDEALSPQRLALDWLLQDSYSMNSSDDDCIIQRFALAVFYFSTHIVPTWINGLRVESSRSSCSLRNGFDRWRSNDEAAVVGSRSGGSIPKEIGLLTSLTDLSLDSSNLEGTIPSEIRFLTSLVRLDLYENNLEGTIPSETGRLVALTTLRLGSNNLDKTIPSEIGLLSSLVRLDLYDNNFDGTVPSEIGSLSGLESLGLFGNDLEGSIPYEIGLLSALTWLGLGSNNLEDTIPSELGLLSYLASATLYGNSFEGTIPSELGMMSLLTELDLGNNKLEGAIPSELGLLSCMTWLTLSINNLEGTVPSEVLSLSSLEVLSVYGNDKLEGAFFEQRSPSEDASPPWCPVDDYTFGGVNESSNERRGGSGVWHFFLGVVLLAICPTFLHLKQRDRGKSHQQHPLTQQARNTMLHSKPPHCGRTQQ